MFVISQKLGRDEVDFLHANKQTFLQVDTINLKFSKVTSLQNFCNISRKEWGMKLIFCADEHHSYLYIDTIIFDGCDQACLKYSK